MWSRWETVSNLRDPSSGLLNAAYFEVAVPARVEVARRALRPLSVVLVRTSGAVGETWECAAVVHRCLRAADTACQVADDTIGLILEETPEDGALWTAERLRRDLEETMPGSTVWIGVATYPAHALNAAGILAACGDALEAAAEWPGSSIVVAHQQ